MTQISVKKFSAELQKQLFPENEFYKKSRTETGIGASVESVDIPVSLRGNMKLQSWDPLTGNIRGLGTENIFNNKTLINSTNSTLKLEAYQSMFWIGERVK